ncbi:MAG: M23 family metallopeptidase [Bdellovibrionales bacterium]
MQRNPFNIPSFKQNWQEFSLAHGRYFFVLAALGLCFFPSKHTADTQISFDTPFIQGSLVNAGELILLDTELPLMLDKRSFSKIQGTSFKMAAAGLYSPDTVYIHYTEPPKSNWRESLRSYFRGPKNNWFKQALRVNKPDLDQSEDLRLPSTVIKKLESASDLQKKKDRMKTREVLSRRTGDVTKLCFKKPVRNIRTSKYGSPRTLPSGRQYYHSGVDLRAWTGASIYSAGSGIVALAELMIVPGNNVIIDHGGGLFSRYMHFSEITTEAGARTIAGTRIGKSGTTGRSNAPHLHWEMIWKGTRINPLQFVKAWDSVCLNSI